MRRKIPGFAKPIPCWTQKVLGAEQVQKIRIIIAFRRLSWEKLKAVEPPSISRQHRAHLQIANLIDTVRAEIGS